MGNWLGMLDVVFDFCNCDTWCAVILQWIYRFLTLIFKVIGMFADLLHIAFYIFSGVDVNSVYDPTSQNIYDITVNGTRKNILDYFLFSESLTKAYFMLAGIGLLLIVVFTIYKIIKQDYFEKAGPRSKGPIFRNVAISCISFLLVIPIFYLIVHVSSLLAVGVMEAMGMQTNKFAGAQIFELSWSDTGKSVIFVNDALAGTGNDGLTWMEELHSDTWFALAVDGKYVRYDPVIMKALGEPVLWTGPLKKAGILDNAGQSIGADFYWYIYLVGVFTAIKALYKMMLAMLQRIFMLMGLFLVAPSPISQYVLDDGAKFKDWLKRSIHQGLRLVVACMSFAIYLITLGLIGNISFTDAFSSATNQNKAEAFNVSTSLLVYTSEPARLSAPMLASEGGFFDSLVNAFLRIFMLMGAGGAITDLDGVLTPLITGEKGSLDAGATGAAADKVTKAATGVAKAAVGIAAGGIGAAVGAVKGSIDTADAGHQGRVDGAEHEARQANMADGAESSSDKKDKTAKGPESGAGAATDVPENNKDNENEENGANGPDGEGKDKEALTEAVTDAVNGDEENKNEDSEEEAGKVDGAEHESRQANMQGKGKEDSGSEENGDADGDNEASSAKDEEPSEKEPGKVKQLLSRVGHAVGRAGKAVGFGVLGTAKGLAFAAPLAMIKSVGKGIKKSVGGLGKQLLAKVGINTDAVAGAYKGARDEQKEKGKQRYEKSKQKTFDKKREERLNKAAETANAKGEAATAQAERVNEAVETENAAAEDLREAQNAAEGANNAAAAANDAVDRENDASNDKDYNKMGKDITQLENQNVAIESAYGDKEKITSDINELTEKRDAAQANKVANDKELERVNSALKKTKAKSQRQKLTKEKEELEARGRSYESEYNAAQNGIAEREAQIAKLDENNKAIGELTAKRTTIEGKYKSKQTMARTLSGADGQLAKAGVSESMTFDEAKKAVELNGSDELKAAFNSKGAKAMYENKNVSAARKANEAASEANQTLSAAQQSYNEAHENTQAQQTALGEKVAEYTRAAGVVDTLSHSFDGRHKKGKQHKYTGENIEGKEIVTRRRKRAEKVRAGMEENSKRVASAASEANQYVTESEAMRQEAEEQRQKPRILLQETKSAAQHAQEKTLAVGQKLNEYVKEHSNTQFVDGSSGTNVTKTLGEVIGKPNERTGAKLENLYKKLSNEERSKVFTPELQGLMEEYNDAYAQQVKLRSNATTSAGVVNAHKAQSASAENRLSGIHNEYTDRVEKAKIIEKVIANPGKASAEDLKVIEREAGKINYDQYTSKKGVIDTNAAIKEKATEARNSNINHQADLLKAAQEIRSEKSKNDADFNAMIDALMKSSGVKTNSQQDSKPAGQTIINNTTNNNMNGAGGVNTKNADPLADVLSQLQGLANANSNKATSPGVAAQTPEIILTRLQDGMRGMETMMSEMKKENQEILSDTDKIRKKMDKPKDE